MADDLVLIGIASFSLGWSGAALCMILFRETFWAVLRGAGLLAAPLLVTWIVDQLWIGWMIVIGMVWVRLFMSWHDSWHNSRPDSLAIQEEAAFRDFDRLIEAARNIKRVGTND